MPIRLAGLSAERIISGTLLRLASITAGKKLAGAVPEVDISTTGFWVDFASPKAKNADDRSSTWLKHFIFKCSVNANVRGEFLAPGDIQA